MGAATIHPFPARMAPEIALDHLGGTAGALAVLDPMCGSGTVLSAASLHGHDAVGFDLDPLAVLMSTVATSPIDHEQLVEECHGVLGAARASRVDAPRWSDAETVKFAEFWFGASQRKQLNLLASAIDGVADDSIRGALQIALSRTIITKAPKASLAADTSHSRPHRVITESNYDVYGGFASSVARLSSLLAQRKLVGTVKVGAGDSRALPLGDGSVDLIITSPPYLNAIDYLRGHKMSLIWLGYTIPEIRKIRARSIGAEGALDIEIREQVNDMVSLIQRSVDFPEKLPIDTIARFAHDLTLYALELHRVCRPNAEVVTVIGNSTLRGNYIRNDELVEVAYANAGFRQLSSVERELPASSRYLPVNTQDGDSSMAKRMRKEVVLVVRKDER